MSAIETEPGRNEAPPGKRWRQAEVARMRREGESLDRGACPSCGAAITGKIDPRQVNYRCACGYKVDRKELVAGE